MEAEARVKEPEGQMQSQEATAIAVIHLLDSAQKQQAHDLADLRSRMEEDAAKSDAMTAKLRQFQTITLRGSERGRPYEPWVKMIVMQLEADGVSSSICSSVIHSVIDALPNLKGIVTVHG